MRHQVPHRRRKWQGLLRTWMQTNPNRKHVVVQWMSQGIIHNEERHFTKNWTTSKMKHVHTGVIGTQIWKSTQVTGLRTWMQTNPKRKHVVVHGMSKCIIHNERRHFTKTEQPQKWNMYTLMKKGRKFESQRWQLINAVFPLVVQRNICIRSQGSWQFDAIWDNI